MENIRDSLVQEVVKHNKKKFLSFVIDDSIYGIKIEKVVDIIRMQEVTYFPNQKNYIKGLINLRGKIVPAIDIRLKFNKMEKEYDDRTCMIVVEEGNDVVGVIVDTINEVNNISEDKIFIPDGLNDFYMNEYAVGIANVEKDSIILLDCKKILE